MKIVNRICQILAIVLGAAAVALFFFPSLVEFAQGQASAGATGAQLAFGSGVDFGGKTYDMQSSSKILFCLIVTTLGFAMSCFSFKKKGLRYTVPVFGLISGIYMLVMALGSIYDYIDLRPIGNEVSGLSVSYTSFMLLTAIAILIFAVLSIAYLLIDDCIEVAASNGEKKTIFKRVIGFFRDYKSEVKKIVWPGFKDVLKNTAIVLVMCLIIGAIIWLIDLGLGALLERLWS